MAEPKISEDTQKLIDEFDRVVENAEQVRNQAEESMRRRPLWPDRRERQRGAPEKDPNRHEKHHAT